MGMTTLLFQNKIKAFITAVLVICLLSACDDSKPCIDGDDFGMPKITLKGEGIDVEGIEQKEVSKWKDTELVVDGSPLIFQVYGRWFPLLKGNESVVTMPCRFEDAGTNPVNPDLIGGGFKIIDNSWPCFLTKGNGVYGLLMPTDVSTGAADVIHGNFDPIPNPNDNYLFRRNPPGGNTFHLGDPDLSGMFPPPATFDFESDPGGGVMPDKPISPSGGGPTDPDLLHGTLNYVGDGNSVPYERLYFKILDQYYTDNSGEVVVKIRSGARSPYPGIFEAMILAITNVFETTAETIYRRLTENTDYIGAVQAMLVLYIAIYGLMYVMGMVPPETSQKVFLVKIIKFGIIGMLISPYSFEFFDTYLIKIFVDGMHQTVNIVSAAVAGPASSTSERMTFFDDVLDKLFSQETQIKIWSLFWSPNPDNDWIALPNPKGLIFIPVIYILILFFVMTLFKTLLIYLMALITLALLIAMAPIFIPFLLFEKTKDLFEGWLKAMIGHWLQPVMLFGMLTLFYVILMELLYKTIGYRTCWNIWWTGELWPNSAPFDIIPGELRAWMPNVRDKREEILVPPFYYIDYSTFITDHPEFSPGSGDKINIFLDVPDYLLGSQERLVDYPALDPNNPVEEDKLEDALDGTVTSFYDILIFGIVIFLMYKFADKVQVIAREIAGITHGGPIELGGAGLWKAVVGVGKGVIGKGMSSLSSLASSSKKGPQGGAGGSGGDRRVRRGGALSVTGGDTDDSAISVSSSGSKTGGGTDKSSGGKRGGSGDGISSATSSDNPMAASAGKAVGVLAVATGGASDVSSSRDKPAPKSSGITDSMLSSADGISVSSGSSAAKLTAEAIAAHKSKPLPPIPGKGKKAETPGSGSDDADDATTSSSSYSKTKAMAAVKRAGAIGSGPDEDLPLDTTSTSGLSQDSIQRSMADRPDITPVKESDIAPDKEKGKDKSKGDNDVDEPQKQQPQADKSKAEDEPAAKGKAKDSVAEYQYALGQAMNAQRSAKSRLDSLKKEDPMYNDAKLALEKAEKALGDLMQKGNSAE